MPNPIVLIAFNRPDLLQRQLETLHEYSGRTIFAIIDGPRPNRPDDVENVRLVLEQLDSLKQRFILHKLTSDTNLGVYKRIKSGLNWVFEQTEQAIILEDDCLPGPGFIDFTDEMLDRFADAEDIYSVSGTNLFPLLNTDRLRYFFCRYHNCWGWATWARAWRKLLVERDEWLTLRKSPEFNRLFPNPRARLYWRHILDKTYSGEIQSWFYRWMLTCWVNNGLAVVPGANLISNLGSGDAATNTASSPFMNRPVGDISQFSRTPDSSSPFSDYDITLEDTMYSKSLMNRFRWLSRKLQSR